MENSRSSGSLLQDPSANWTIPQTGLESVCRGQKWRIKKNKKPTTPENCTFFLNVGEQTGICKYCLSFCLSDRLDLFIVTAGASLDDLCDLSLICFNSP